MRPPTQAFFLPVATGQRLCILHPPATGAARAAIVYVHPWAEEMNKSRRMAALQSRAFAAAGHAVLQIDLRGCGDSSEDFASASWSDWVDDVVSAVQWLRTRHNAPLWLWGLRAGCLLAVQAARRVEDCRRFLFWQPCVDGKAQLQQFMRIQAAAGLQQSDAKASMTGLRAELAAGRPVEIAGYNLSPELANGLGEARLEPLSQPSHVVWRELSTRKDAALLPASRQCIDAWRSAGHGVDAAIVTGPSFWQTQEIEDAPALIDATLAVLRETAAA